MAEFKGREQHLVEEGLAIKVPAIERQPRPFNRCPLRPGGSGLR
jgi:hypothetical protein